MDCKNQAPESDPAENASMHKSDSGQGIEEERPDDTDQDPVKTLSGSECQPNESGSLLEEEELDGEETAPCFARRVVTTKFADAISGSDVASPDVAVEVRGNVSRQPVLEQCPCPDPSPDMPRRKGDMYVHHAREKAKQVFDQEMIRAKVKVTRKCPKVSYSRLDCAWIWSSTTCRVTAVSLIYNSLTITLKR